MSSRPSDASSSPAPDTGTELRAVTVELIHYAIEWQECGEDGLPDLGKPLTPFCAACTDDEWVSAVEFGDTIDAAAGVVSWPCPTLEAHRAEVAARVDLAVEEARAQGRREAMLEVAREIGYSDDWLRARAAGEVASGHREECDSTRDPR